MHFFLWFFFFLSALVWKEAEGKEIHDVKLLIMRKTLFAIIYLTDFFYALKFISSDLYVFTPFRRESRWNTANWFSRGYVGKLLRGCVKEKQCAFPFQLFFFFLSFFPSFFVRLLVHLWVFLRYTISEVSFILNCSNTHSLIQLGPWKQWHVMNASNPVWL